jgi:hypothetical protein
MNPDSEVAMGFRSFTCGQHKESMVRMLQKDHVRLLFKLMSWGAKPKFREFNPACNLERSARSSQSRLDTEKGLG